MHALTLNPHTNADGRDDTHWQPLHPLQYKSNSSHSQERVDHMAGYRTDYCTLQRVELWCNLPQKNSDSLYISKCTSTEFTSMYIEYFWWDTLPRPHHRSSMVFNMIIPSILAGGRQFSVDIGSWGPPQTDAICRGYRFRFELIFPHFWVDHVEMMMIWTWTGIRFPRMTQITQIH